MNQKGFINIILVIIVVVLVGTGTYFISTRQITPPTPSPTPSPIPTPSPTPTPTIKPNPTPTTISNRTNWDSGKEYFYYSSDKKIPLKFLGMKDGRPHFMTQDSTKAEILLTDEFMVKIKSGVTREELDVLNRKYSVSIVNNIYGTDDKFVLTVKSDPSNNALDMANLYHNQTIIEWTEPDFILLSVRQL